MANRQEPYVPKRYSLRRCIRCLSEFQPRRFDQIYCGGHRDRTCEHALLNLQQNLQSWKVRALEAQDGNCAWCGVMGREKAYGLHVPEPLASPVLSLMFLRPWLAPYDSGFVASCAACRRDHYSTTAERLYNEPQYAGLEHPSLRKPELMAEADDIDIILNAVETAV